MCDFVCGTMSRAQSLLHWSIIHYKVTFERHSGCGSTVVRKRLLVVDKTNRILYFLSWTSASQHWVNYKINFMLLGKKSS